MSHYDAARELAHQASAQFLVAMLAEFTPVADQCGSVVGYLSPVDRREP